MTLIISDACLVLCLKAGNMKADRHFQGGPVLFPGSETEVQRPSLQFLPALPLQPGCPSKQMGPLHAAGWPVPLTQEPPSPASDPPGLKSPPGCSSHWSLRPVTSSRGSLWATCPSASLPHSYSSLPSEDCF